MKSLVLSKFPWPAMTSAGLLIFLAVFAGVVIWVHRRGSKKIYESASQLPLQEG